MPSILGTKARRVLSYFNKYGFANVRLTILILDPSGTREQAIELEQYFMDTRMAAAILIDGPPYGRPINSKIKS